MKKAICRAAVFSPASLPDVTIPIKEQLLAFFFAFLSGASFALVYDLFAAVRKRFHSRIAAALMDGIYCLSVAAALFLFTLHLGDGRPRLYLLAAIALGATVYFSLPASYFRPIWNFWLDCFLLTLSFGDAPRRFFLRWYQNVQKRCKKLFYFATKCVIMFACKPRNTKETRQWQRKRPQKRK